MLVEEVVFLVTFVLVLFGLLKLKRVRTFLVDFGISDNTELYGTVFLFFRVKLLSRAKLVLIEYMREQIGR